MTCLKVSATRRWAGLSVIESCDRMIRKALLLWMFGPFSHQPSHCLQRRSPTHTHTQCPYLIYLTLYLPQSKIITQWNPTAHSVIPATLLHTHSFIFSVNMIGLTVQDPGNMASHYITKYQVKCEINWCDDMSRLLLVHEEWRQYSLWFTSVEERICGIKPPWKQRGCRC